MKKIITLSLTLAMVFCFVGCEDEKTPPTNKTDNNHIEIWTDEETGVQYIIYSESGGYSGYGGITPRLNADGTLYMVGDSE